MSEEFLRSLLGYPGGLFYLAPASFDTPEDLNQWLGLARIGSTEDTTTPGGVADFAAYDGRGDFAAIYGRSDYAATDGRGDFTAIKSGNVPKG